MIVTAYIDVIGEEYPNAVGGLNSFVHLVESSAVL